MKILYPLLILLMLSSCNDKPDDSSMRLTLSLNNKMLQALNDNIYSVILNSNYDVDSSSYNETFRIRLLQQQFQEWYAVIKEDTISDLYTFMDSIKFLILRSPYNENDLSKNRYAYYYRFHIQDTCYTPEEATNQLLQIEYRWLLEEQTAHHYMNRRYAYNSNWPNINKSYLVTVRVSDNELILVRNKQSSRLRYYDYDSIIYKCVYYKNLPLPADVVERDNSSYATLEKFRIVYPNIGNAEKKDVIIADEYYYNNSWGQSSFVHWTN